MNFKSHQAYVLMTFFIRRDNMEEIFSQQNHHLSYNVQERPDLTIGITTRTDGHSPYPNNAFNMARYIDDNPENITKHQRILADEIGFYITRDRKSTRLNSSHVSISYAVFCLKKKRTK